MAIIISNVIINTIKTNTVIIKWDSVTGASSQIEYSTDLSYNLSTAEDILSYFHITPLIGLSQGTTYNFRIRAKEYDGTETVSSNYTFVTRTQAQLDTVIQNARTSQGGSGLPKVYYVKPTGNDALDGLSEANAWRTPSVAVSRAYAGDTIYVLSGTWNNQYIVFPRSGIDVAPITIKAYTAANPPLFDGVDRTGIPFDINYKDYINIEGINAFRYGTAIGRPASYLSVSNCEFRYYGGAIVVIADLHSGDTVGSYYNSLNNCTLEDSGWNMIQLIGREYQAWPEATVSHHINITNNLFINHTQYHSGSIDIMGECNHINITGNTYDNDIGDTIYVHALFYNNVKYINFSNNIVRNSATTNLQGIYNSLFSNNTIENATQAFIVGCWDPICTAVDNTIRNNSIYGTTFIPVDLHGPTIFEENYNDGDGLIFNFRQDYDYITRNQRNTTYLFYLEGYGKNTVEYTDGRVFEITHGLWGPGAYSLTPPQYLPNKSISNQSSLDYNYVSFDVVTYPMTVRPVSGSATVTVNKFNTSLPMGSELINATINITNGINVQFSVSTLVPSANYQIKRNGVNYVIVTADSNGVINFQNSVWTGNTGIISITQTSAPPPLQGTLSVTTTPVSGDIYVNGVLRGNGTISISLDAGTYTVSFGEVGGYITPSNQIVTITSGQLTAITGIYQLICPAPIATIQITSA